MARKAKPTLAAEQVTRSADPSSYESLRIVGDVHKLRFGTSSKLVSAGDGQSIHYRDTPFAHFEVLPSGVQIPVSNVTSAIPTTASINAKVTRTGRLEERRKRLDVKMKAQEAEARGAVVDDDDADESLTEDPDDAR